MQDYFIFFKSNGHFLSVDKILTEAYSIAHISFRQDLTVCRDLECSMQWNKNLEYVLESWLVIIFLT